MGGIDPSMPIAVEGKNPVPVQGEIVTRYRAVGEDYFRTLQIPMLQGRAFHQGDTANTPAVAIVSESLARKYWPGENPVGKRLKPDFQGSSWCTVVGVAGDVRHWAADVDIEPTAYYPYTQIPDTIRPLLEANMGIAVRSSLGEGALLPSIRAAVADVDKNVPVYEVETMDSKVTDSQSLRRFDLWLLGMFSGLALGLAAIGVYAVMAYSVSQRTREIGIRIAMGARSQQVLSLILLQGARLALAGVIAGIVGALLLTHIMASLLYGLGATDPLIFSIVPLSILLVILLACYLPAHRATKVDPMVALRYE
jgi:putative ABC transport system permease protein